MTFLLISSNLLHFTVGKSKLQRGQRGLESQVRPATSIQDSWFLVCCSSHHINSPNTRWQIPRGESVITLLPVQDTLTLLTSLCNPPPPTWSSPCPESTLTCLWTFYWSAGWRPRPPGEEDPGPPCTAAAYTPGRVGCLPRRSAWPHQSPGAHPTCRSGRHTPPLPHPGAWWSVGHHRRRSEAPGRCYSHWHPRVWCHWQPH